MVEGRLLGAMTECVSFRSSKPEQGWGAGVLLLAATLVAGCQSANSNSVRTSRDQAKGGETSISSFQGEYRFLSNFYPATVNYQGIAYPTVEHAYQSAKTLDMNERRRIASLATPSEAKRAGRALKLRSDWEAVKLDVMEDCVRAKFSQSADLRQRLLATGAAELIEGNSWGDQFWGVCDGKGENHLGRILMKVRSNLTSR